VKREIILITGGWMCEVLCKVKFTTPPCSSTSKCLVIYKTAVICRHIAWFPVFTYFKTIPQRHHQYLV